MMMSNVAWEADTIESVSADRSSDTPSRRMRIRALETVVRKKESRGRPLDRPHIDKHRIQPVVEHLVEHAHLYPRPQRFMGRAHDADSSPHIVKPAKNTKLFIGGQPADVFKHECRDVSRRRQ